MKKEFAIVSTAIALALAGCSGSAAPGELRTSSEAQHFVADIARGGSTASWHLTSKAQGDALRAWAEQAAIADFGARIRGLRYAIWACDLAEGSAQIGYGRFTEGDRITVVSIARHKGAKPAQIDPLVADVTKIANPDLQIASTALCG
jgi:hypothetical protein